ncbi:MAG: protein kinase [bacterium]|nr:protein kinase [bacterium]
MDGTQKPAVSQAPILKTLLVSDLVASTRLVEELGDRAAAELGQRHDRLARDLMATYKSLEIDKTDGFLLLFDRPLDAVRYALEYHAVLRRLSEQEGRRIEARVGIHLGEVWLHENPPEDVARGAKPLEVEGLAKPTTGRLMSLARGGQVLLTRGAFDLARRAAVGVLGEDKVSWLAHGGYLFKGVAEPVEVFEVGREGSAPLEPPGDSTKVRRVVEQKTILGWRPAPGLEIPRRPNWAVEKKLGEGGFGEVWLAAHRKTHERRVFKFCYEAERLRSLQHEITLFRLLKEELGDRDDIARILDWNLEEAPYFIESVYTEGGSLVEWAKAMGGIAEVPLADRLEIVAQVAEALAAAHSVGVLHKDVKPANVLITSDHDGSPRAVLTDFGVGLITDRDKLQSHDITVLGLTEVKSPTDDVASTAGTRLYLAPELLEGKAATVQADIYALGVVLYQLVAGDLRRALGPGWKRGVEDELLREDIALSVDVSPRRRLGHALRLAERLRSLEDRRARRESERRAREEAQRTRAALERSSRQRKLAAAALVLLLAFGAVVSTLWRRAVVATSRAEAEAKRAEAEANRAEAGKLVALGRLELSPDSREYCPSTALAYAIAAIERNDGPEARRFALEALWRGPTGFALGPGNLTDPFAADGSWLAQVTSGEVRVWPRSATVPDTIPVDLERFGGGYRYIQGTQEPDVIQIGVWGRWPIEFWSVEDRELLQTFDQDSACGSVMPSGTGTVICLEQRGRRTEVRELPLRGGEPRTLGSLESAIVGAAYTARQDLEIGAAQGGATVSGRSLVTFKDRTLRLHDLDRLDLGSRVIGQHDSPVTNANLYGPAKTLLSADRSGNIKIWSLAGAGAELVSERRGPPALMDVSVDRELRTLAAASRSEGTVWLRDLRGPPTAEPLVFHRRGMKQATRVSVEQRGQWLATGGVPTGLTLWPLHRRHPFVVSREFGKVWSFASHPDGLAVGADDGSVTVWPLVPEAGEARRVLFRAPQGHVSSLATDPRGRWLLAGAAGGPWLIPLDGGPPKALPGFESLAWAVAFSPDGRYAAAGGGHRDSSERVIRIWDLQTGEQVQVLGPPDLEAPGGGQIIWLLYSPDGRRLFSSGFTGVLAWDLEDGSYEYLGKGFLTAITRDGKSLFVAWTDWRESGGAGVYDLGTGALRELPTHGKAGTIALSPDETVVVTGGIDGTIRVGPVDGGEPHILMGHTGFTAAGVSPDGRWIVSGSTDGSLRVWPMPDLSRPPLHTLPRDELIARLESLTNFRAVRDDAEPDGYRIETEPFAGWDSVPDW